MEELPSYFSISQIIGFIISLSFCALFSFLETSITALRLFQIKELSKSTAKYKNFFEILEKNPHRILITILIISSLANATTAAIITHIMENFFAHFNLSESLGFSIGIFIATSAILIFGEIIPKHIAKYHGESFFKSTLWIANGIFYLLYPFVKFLTKISDFFTKKIGNETQFENEPSENEIQFLINYINEKGLMEPSKTEMLKNVFQLEKKLVKEIMIPKIDMITIDAKTNIKNALTVFSKFQFSRIPVFENDHDNIIGIVHQKDIFQLLQNNYDEKIVKEIIRPIIFVPKSLKINQLLRQFKQQKMHMAMVLNEYGGISGLVTLEDVLEEIVGDISDEHEEIAKKIVSLKENEWIIDAAIPLDDLSNLLNISFETEDVITLGGFLTEQLQNLPKKGDKIFYKKYSFQIQQASAKKVLQVLVSKEQKYLDSQYINK